MPSEVSRPGQHSQFALSKRRSGKDDLACPYLADGSNQATELGYSAFRGRSPGKEHLLAEAGQYTAFLENKTVRLDNGSLVNALWLNAECLFGTNLSNSCINNIYLFLKILVRYIYYMN